MLFSIYTKLWIIPAQLKSKVSESFELTSIVFRLAGAKEYVNNDIPAYAKDIDDYFAKYDTHEIVDYIKELREKHHIGYDAVSAAAALIEINNRKVRIKPGTDAETISNYDDRWSGFRFKKFVTLLDHFYKATRFNDFFLQHSGLYKIAEERMDKLLSWIDVQWFESFFGEKLLHVRVIPMLSMCFPEVLIQR